MVRRVGSGVSHDPLCASRPRVREASAGAAVARMVHASQRADPGVRVRARRRQPAGACVGMLARVQDDRPARAPRPPVPGAHLPEAAAQLHLVGEPQGPRGEEPLCRGLPRPRQHRRVRPLPAAAHWGPPRAGGRHRVDGVLLRHDAVHRPGARERGRGLRRHRHEVLRALCGDRRRDEHPRWHGAVGRSGRVLLRPTRRGRHEDGPASPLDGGPSPAHRLRDRGDGDARASPRLHHAYGMVHTQPRRPRATRLDVRRGARPEPPAPPARPAAPRAAGARAPLRARRERVLVPLRHPVSLQGAPGASVRPSGRRPGIPSGLRPRGIEHRVVRREFELARSNLASAQLPVDRGAGAL